MSASGPISKQHLSPLNRQNPHFVSVFLKVARGVSTLQSQTSSQYLCYLFAVPRIACTGVLLSVVGAFLISYLSDGYRVDERTKERSVGGERTSERTSERTNERMRPGGEEGTNKRTGREEDERTNERTNERTSDRVGGERTNKRTNDGTFFQRNFSQALQWKA